LALGKSQVYHSQKAHLVDYRNYKPMIFPSFSANNKKVAFMCFQQQAEATHGLSQGLTGVNQRSG
jgi:hypothetical protein